MWTLGSPGRLKKADFVTKKLCSCGSVLRDTLRTCSKYGTVAFQKRGERRH